MPGKRATAVCVWRLVFATSMLFTPRSWGMTCHMNAICTSLKSTFSGLQLCCWQIRVYLHSLSCYCLRNTRNVAKFYENLTLQPFKVIQGHRSWCQWKAHTCDFLLVINCSFSRICICYTVFEIFRLKDRKLLILPICPLFDAPARGNFWMKLTLQKLEGWGYVWWKLHDCSSLPFLRY